LSTILAGIGTVGLMAVSLPARAQSDVMPIAISSYYDTVRNTSQVFYMDAYGGVDAQSFTDGASGGWSCTRTLPACTVVYRNGTPIGCTSLNTAEFAPGGNLVAAFDGSYGHLYYIGNDATLWEAYGNPPSTTHSLTAPSGASTTPWSEWSTYSSPPLAGYTIPGLNPAATLAVYDVGPSDQHIFFRGRADNLLHETYYNGSWHDRLVNSTVPVTNVFSGAGMTAFWDGTVGHVFVPTTNVELQEYYFYNGNWWGGVSGTGPGYPEDFLASVVSSNGGTFHESVYGSSSTTGDLAEANYTSATWWTESTSVPPGGNIWGSRMLAFSSPSQDYVLYVGGDNNVYSTQLAQAINVSAGAPAVAQSGTPVHQSPLTGFWDPHIGYAFVFYVGTDSDVHQLYATSGAGPWYHTNMTTNANCYVAAH
jgi:hypothetical protein